MKKYKILLWLDDARDPFKMDWLMRFAPNYEYEKETHKVAWVESYEEFVKWIEFHGLPDEIGFDHDLGRNKSGMDAAKWLVEYCLDNSLELPDWFVQSANPVGKRNINGLLENFKNSQTQL